MQLQMKKKEIIGKKITLVVDWIIIVFLICFTVFSAWLISFDYSEYMEYPIIVHFLTIMLCIASVMLTVSSINKLIFRYLEKSQKDGHAKERENIWHI